MHLNNLYWWLIIISNLVGYFIFRFGMISKGNAKEIIEFAGGIIAFISFVLMFIVFGIKSGLIQIVIFLVAITPIVELIIRKINKKLYGHYIEMEKRKKILENRFIPDVIKQELLKKRNEK